MPAPDDPSFGSGFLIRPDRKRANTFVVVFGGLTVLIVAIFLLEGTVSAALLCAAIGGVGCYAVLGNRVRANGERIWANGVFLRGSCRREDLDCFLITPGYRGRPTCRVIRKDRKTAFQIPVMMFGEAQLAALASYLGVPLHHLT